MIDKLARSSPDDKRKVDKLNVPVAAGERLWLSGDYGSSAYRTGLLHWEIFSEDHLFENMVLPAGFIDPTQPATEASSAQAHRKIFIRTLEGPKEADCNQNVIYKVTGFNVADVTPAETAQVNWLVEWTGGSKKFMKKGAVLEFDIPEAAAGGTVTAQPFMNSPSEKIKVETKVTDLVAVDWVLVEDKDSDFNIDSKSVLELFGSEILGEDNVITSKELKSFFASDNKNVNALRNHVCKFMSEWGIPDLDASIDKMKNRSFVRTIGLKRRLEPYIWWDDAVASGVGIPKSGLVWHYNPITFLDAMIPTNRTVSVALSENINIHQAAVEQFNEKWEIVPREEWGSLSPNYSAMAPDWDYTAIAIHHSGNQYREEPRELEIYHMVEEGFDDIGYHYIIDRPGDIYESRKLFLQGAHIISNEHSTGKVGILLMGDFSPEWWDIDEEPTSEQLASLLTLSQALTSFFPGIREFGGHRDWKRDTKCPGEDLYKELNNFRKKLNLRKPVAIPKTAY